MYRRKRVDNPFQKVGRHTWLKISLQETSKTFRYDSGYNPTLRPHRSACGTTGFEIVQQSDVRCCTVCITLMIGKGYILILTERA